MSNLVYLGGDPKVFSRTAGIGTIEDLQDYAIVCMHNDTGKHTVCKNISQVVELTGLTQDDILPKLIKPILANFYMLYYDTCN